MEYTVKSFAKFLWEERGVRKIESLRAREVDSFFEEVLSGVEGEFAVSFESFIYRSPGCALREPQTEEEAWGGGAQSEEAPEVTRDVKITITLEGRDPGAEWDLVSGLAEVEVLDDPREVLEDWIAEGEWEARDWYFVFEEPGRNLSGSYSMYDFTEEMIDYLRAEIEGIRDSLPAPEGWQAEGEEVLFL